MDSTRSSCAFFAQKDKVVIITIQKTAMNYFSGFHCSPVIFLKVNYEELNVNVFGLCVFSRILRKFV